LIYILVELKIKVLTSFICIFYVSFGSARVRSTHLLPFANDAKDLTDDSSACDLRNIEDEVYLQTLTAHVLFIIIELPCTADDIREHVKTCTSRFVELITLSAQYGIIGDLSNVV